MKENIAVIINNYLKVFPNEKERLALVSDFLLSSDENDLIDWNNYKGHLTASAIVYSKNEDSFLVLHHKDLNMYMYPGGHIDSNDKSLLEAALRELYEETGLSDLELYSVMEGKNIPLDIDTHIIPFNERVNMKEHYHFDFRYLFLVNEPCEVKIDKSECSSYKWISSNDLIEDEVFSVIVKKIKNLL